MKFGRKKIKLLVYVMSFSAFVTAMALGFGFFNSILAVPQSYPHKEISNTFWNYQCIDTMKTSRDKAREWASRSDLKTLIDKEMKEIADLGANCVALDTPYDSEFLPYLTKWIQSARNYNLKIWFRGNFSSWEGWFDYPKGMSSADLLDKTKNFIKTNKDLFADNDIFTPAPEGENGGPFNQVEKDEYTTFRKFLIDEYNITTDAFRNINKKVITNWFSMNGGLARRMLDQKTIDSIGGLVTIDHYINSADKMSEFINYFKNTFKSKVTIGEWGAPIPEINGSMTEKQQADFNDSLLKEMLKEKDVVDGINYWVLYDSSTALLNEDYSERLSANIIRKYYKPVIIKGTIRNDINEPLIDVEVSSGDGLSKSKTDEYGNFELLLLNDNTSITATKTNYKDVKEDIQISDNKASDLNFKMENIKPGLFYKLKQDIINGK